MALKKLVGLAAIGGFLYAHKRRGGQLTIDSFKQTARSLIDDISGRARELKSQAEQKLSETRRGGEFAGSQQQTTTVGEDVTGYSSAGYGYGNDDLSRR